MLIYSIYNHLLAYIFILILKFLQFLMQFINFNLKKIYVNEVTYVNIFLNLNL